MHRPAPVSISPASGATAANPPFAAAAAHNGTDRQTDRQTPYRCIDPAAYYADSDNNWRPAMQSVPRHRPMLLVTCDHYVKLDLTSRHIGTIITRYITDCL